jgi:arginine exporter protein ArgO
LLGLRRLAILAVAGVVAMLALAAWIITGVVLLLQGATGGLATILNGRVWLANLIVGGGAVLLVALGIAVTYGAWRAASKQRTRQKYDERQRVQRRQYGHSAHDRASGQ